MAASGQSRIQVMSARFVFWACLCSSSFAIDEANARVTADGMTVVGHQPHDETFLSRKGNARREVYEDIITRVFERKHREIRECTDVDNLAYLSPLGLGCESVRGFNCAMFSAIGFSEEELYHLINSCPDSCDVPCGSWTLPPSSSPSFSPSVSQGPTSNPSSMPTDFPSSSPSTSPTSRPSYTPSLTPSARPSISPTSIPSSQPSALPSSNPTSSPSSIPTTNPSAAPSAEPTSSPSAHPSLSPSGIPTTLPSFEPSSSPSSTPTSLPSTEPSAEPSASPSSAPSSNLDFVSYLADSMRRDLERVMAAIDELERRSSIAEMRLSNQEKSAEDMDSADDNAIF